MTFEKAVSDCLYLFSLSDSHRHYTIEDFYTFLVFPLRHQKARLFYDGDTPVGVVTWAFFTEDEAQAFLDETWLPSESVYARANGEQLWGIEIIAPFGQTRRIMRAMREHSKKLYGIREARWRRLHKPNVICKGEFT